MKRCLSFVLISLIALTALCRQRNMIYVLDCTKSMEGYNGAPDIWEPTKKFLKGELAKEAHNNPDAKISILPFQETNLSPILFVAKDYKWAKIDSILNGHIERITYTNLCDAWVNAETMIDETCDNYLVLMTDGHDNMGGSANEGNRMEQLAKILEAFCGKYENTMGFYLELTNDAKLPNQIQKIIDICDRFFVIDVSKGIPEFGSISSDNISISTRDLPKDIKFSFSNAGIFKAQAKSDNQLLNIALKGDKIDGGEFIIHLESKFGDNQQSLNDAIGGEETELEFVISSDDVQILNSVQSLCLRNAPVRSMEVSTVEIVSAPIERVKPFLWVKGNPVDTVRWEIKPEFNDAALKADAKAKLQIKSYTNIEDCTLRINGKELNDSSFIVSSAQSYMVELIVPQSVGDNDIDFKIYLIKQENIDLINGEHPGSLEIPLEGKIRTSRSMSELIIKIFIVAVILILLAWFLILKKSFYPKFRKGIVTISEPYFSTVHLRGVRKVVFVSVPMHQSLISKLFTGKIFYHVNEAWIAECELTPSGKNIRFRCPSSKLTSIPSPLWQNNMSYMITCKDTNKTIKLTIN